MAQRDELEADPCPSRLARRARNSRRSGHNLGMFAMVLDPVSAPLPARLHLVFAAAPYPSDR